MGRIGVSEYQVFQAADQLRADGVNPSVDSVRQELGTGSRTTINKYLKAWRERYAQREQAGANLGDHLMQVLRQQSEIILSAIESAAQAKFQAKSEQYDVALQKQQQRLTDQDAELARYRTQVSELETQHVQQLSTSQQQQSLLADARDDNQSLRESLAKETGRRETLEGAIGERDRQLSVLQKDLKALQARHEILTESHATKTAELHQIQQRERELRTVVKTKDGDIKRLNQQLKTTAQRHEKDISRLTESVKQLATSKPSARSSTIRG